MHKIKNIFPIIYDFENLFNAYKAGIKCKRYRPDVMAYTDKLEENLIELQNEFIWQTYTVGRYNIFYVYEPKKRMIMSLQFKDRVAQHAIYSQLNPYFEKQFIHDSYACRVGKGTHKAVNRLHNWLKQTDRKPQRFYYLKLDIAKYFYRIDHEVLMDILRKKIADKDLLHVLSVIINCEDTNFGLPLGADIGDVAFDELLGFVGFRIWSTHIKLRKKTAKKLKRRLKYMFAAYHAGEIDKDTLDRSVASYRGILQHFNSYGMRQSLNELYLQEMGKPYPEPEKKPASKCGLFCGYYGSADDYIKQPEEKEVTDSGSNADA